MYIGCVAKSRPSLLPTPPGGSRDQETDFDAMKGIIAASGMALLCFWLPIVVAVVRATP